MDEFQFRIIGQYQGKEAFEVEVGNLNAVDKTDVSYKAVKRDVAYRAVKWIVQNKKKYSVKSGYGKNLFYRLETLPKEAPTEEYIGLLNSFYNEFLNNPYVFECRFWKNVGTKFISSKYIWCYFVLLDGVYIPLGVLNEFVEENKFKEILVAFLENRREQWLEIINKDIELCGKYICSEGNTIQERTELGSSYIRKTVMYALKSTICLATIIIALIVVVKGLILGIDWLNAKEIAENSSNFFQALGFMCEKGYGVNHNSYVNYFKLLLAVIWLIITPFLIAPFNRCRRMCKGYAKRSGIYLKAKCVQHKLNALVGESESELNAIKTTSENTKYFKMGKQQTWLLRNFAKKLEKAGAPDHSSMKRVLNITGSIPAFLTLIIFLTLVLGTAYLNYYSKNAEFLDKANFYTQEVHRLIDEEGFYAKAEYFVTSNSPVYTKPTRDSLVLYELTPWTPYYVVEEYNSEENEDKIQKIRFFTEYGYLSGWIINVEAIPYSPEGDESVVKIEPIVASASRTDFGKPENVMDKKKGTSWGVSGKTSCIGEYVELVLPEIMNVDMFMIQPGKSFLGINGSPVDFIVEFHFGDTVETVEAKLDESLKMQYFTLNKAVTAGMVRFIIDGCIDGNITNDLHILELGVYSKTVQ